jgi:hypothetical protein
VGEAQGQGGQGRIVVSRNDERDIKIRGLEVLLDGEFVANLQFGQSYEAPIPAGSHRVTATNRMFTRHIDFDLAPGREARFTATSVALHGIWTLIALMGTVAYRVSLKQDA